MIQALFAAGLWGGTDALAGISARRSTPLFAALWLHVASIAVIAPIVVGSGGWAVVSWRDAMFGVCAGIVAAIGDVLFGRALSKSSMTVGIPLANVIAAAIPATVAIIQGEPLTLLAGLGMSGALLASALAVAPSNGRMAVEGAGYAALAGICFGAMYALLSQVRAAGGLEVIFLMRCAGMAALLPGVLRSMMQSDTGALKTGLATGMLSGVASVGANWLFVLAVSSGARVTLSVVAIALSAPAAMLIVNLVVRERLTAVQSISAALAVTAIAVLAVPPTIV
jgi:drug/metabolite transporter (DMT)-like permease